MIRACCCFHDSKLKHDGYCEVDDVFERFLNSGHCPSSYDDRQITGVVITVVKTSISFETMKFCLTQMIHLKLNKLQRKKHENTCCPRVKIPFICMIINRKNLIHQIHSQKKAIVAVYSKPTSFANVN